MSGLLKKIQTAHLRYFEFPGGGYSLEVLGLDGPLASLGLSPVPTPRHADNLFITGPITHDLIEPLKHVYAAIPRPRYAIALGESSEALPVPVELTTSFDAHDVEEAVLELRERIAAGYQGAPALEESQAEDSGHGEHDHNDHVSHDNHDDHGDHGGHDHHMHMMDSFQESEDGLALEWITMPLGPVHPATPGGLGLTVTLDGDLVAETTLETGYLARGIVHQALEAESEDAPGTLRWLDPRTPTSPPLLLARALEDLSAVEIPQPARFGRIYLLELERIASHLGWLVGMARVLGAEIAMHHALRARRPILLALRQAHIIPGGLSGELASVDFAAVRKGISDARKLLGYRDLIAYRLEGLATVGRDTQATGPVARASGSAGDARLDDESYAALGFQPVGGEWGDAFARYEVRIQEIEQSLWLAEAAFDRSGIAAAGWQLSAGEVSAVLEGPRGRAQLELQANGDGIHELSLYLPSQMNVELVPDLIQGVSLSDAVAAVWSLDLSVEEVDANG